MKQRGSTRASKWLPPRHLLRHLLRQLVQRGSPLRARLRPSLSRSRASPSRSFYSRMRLTIRAPLCKHPSVIALCGPLLKWRLQQQLQLLQLLRSLLRALQLLAGASIHHHMLAACTRTIATSWRLFMIQSTSLPQRPLRASRASRRGVNVTLLTRLRHSLR